MKSSPGPTTLHAGSLKRDYLMTDERERVFHLCHEAHFATQGKVGSGFDLAAAVFGSQIFCRKHYSHPPLYHQSSSLSSYTDPTAASSFHIQTTCLPKYTQLVLMETSSLHGSKTPSLVGEISKWLDSYYLKRCPPENSTCIVFVYVSILFKFRSGTRKLDKG
jgi:phosphomevalonate kinase